MTRETASHMCRELLNAHGLNDWGVRLNTSVSSRFLGLCSYKDKCIILSAHHIDIHSDADVINTIRHEVAHALTPGHQHNSIWSAKARELGCDNTLPCSNLALSPEIIDAIRSGADILMEVEEQVIRTPKYTVTRLQDKCEVCGKVAKEKQSKDVEIKDDTKPNLKIIHLDCGHIIIKKIPKGTPFHLLVSNSENNEAVKNCKHEWNDDGIVPTLAKNQCKRCLEFKPYPFQVDGMRFVEAGLAINKGACVFDEMGLGKTIQALGYLKYHPEAFPVLYVVKSGIKYQIFKENVRWLGKMYASQVILTSKDYVIPGLKTYIIGYAMLSRFDVSKFAHIKTIVLDECQQISNPDSNRTQKTRILAKDKMVIPLSGTPWKNRGGEFFSVLNMVAPTKFNSHQNFLNRWVDFYISGDKYKQGGIRDIEGFKEYTKDIIIRRERIEVMKDLPVISRNMTFSGLEEDENKAYLEEVSDFVKWYNDRVANDEEDDFETGGTLLGRLGRLRHITGLAKISSTMEYLDEFYEDTDRKIVIFVHHRDVGQILVNKIKEKVSNGEYRGVDVFQISSELDSIERFNVQEAFNKSKRAFMVASTLASGEGLNLQTCSDCIVHERQWNPANEEQVEGRFIRIGQTANAVVASYMIAQGTVDEQFTAIVEKKRQFFHSAMNKGEPPKWNQNDLLKELVDTIVRDHVKNKK